MKSDGIVVLNTDEAAAKLTTLTGWVSRDGRFYGDDERLARWAGATHLKCECGNTHEKGWTCCENCRWQKKEARYEAMPEVEYNSEMVVYSEKHDRYFFDADAIEEFCMPDWEGNDEKDPATLMLVVCDPQRMHQLDPDDIYCDDLPEDTSLEDANPEMWEAFKALNAVIKKQPPLSWFPGKKRTTYKRQEREAA